MTNLELVRNAVIKAVPSIVELGFGCEVEEMPAFGSSFRGNKPEGGKWIATVKDRTGRWMFPTTIGFVCVAEEELIRWHKILGRPIRLADVLAAIGEKGEVLVVDWSGQFRKFAIYHIIGGDGNYMPKWNLLHDDLDWHAEHQPETVAWLAEILG